LGQSQFSGAYHQNLIFFRVKPTIAAGFWGLDALAINNRDAWLFGAAHPFLDALAHQIVDP
jgi:hypothetical protein